MVLHRAPRGIAKILSLMADKLHCVNAHQCTSPLPQPCQHVVSKSLSVYGIGGLSDIHVSGHHNN